MAGYKVKFRHQNPKGKVLGELGPFKLKRDAVKQAQVMADSGHLRKDAIVTVEKVGTKKRRANPKIKMSDVKVGDVVQFSFPNRPSSMGSILVTRLEAFGPDFRASGIYVPRLAKSASQVRQQTTGQKAFTRGRDIKKVIKPNRRKKNPNSRIYKGHQIKGKRGSYKVMPYGYEFTTLKDAKAWLDAHVRDAYPRPRKNR
jgi:hypothetical protein